MVLLLSALDRRQRPTAFFQFTLTDAKLLVFSVERTIGLTALTAGRFPLTDDLLTSLLPGILSSTAAAATELYAFLLPVQPAETAEGPPLPCMQQVS